MDIVKVAERTPDELEPALQVLIANEQSTLPIDEARLRSAVRAVCEDSPFCTGQISVAIVDDPTIHALNRQYLKHDYPTDVLSFVLESDEAHLEGELIVSADMAASNASEYDWPAANELLLYVIHGTLHLVGYRDQQPADIAQMCAAEAIYLQKHGVALPAQQTRWQNPQNPTTGDSPLGKVTNR